MSSAMTEADLLPALPAARHLSTRLVAVMFTDLVDSTGMKARLSAGAYVEMLARHDRALRRAIKVGNGHLRQDTGDGGFATFESASDATRAALLFQWLMHAEAKVPATGIAGARVGIHLGDVAIADEEFQQGGEAKLIGLTVDLSQRVMSLAEPGQILLTRDAFNNARQFLDSHPHISDGVPAPSIQWLAHGHYTFKGSDEPLEVFEVGAAGTAPLCAPPDTAKASRFLAPGEEQTLGWRPAIGRPMENHPNWSISSKLGEGGFGEVWLAEQIKTGAKRVYKFCFDAERLRAMKREVVLFRLLKDAIGARPDIAAIRDWQFDEAPYYIELEYLPDGNLIQWAEAQGGISAVPLKSRLEIMRRIAEALSAAHSVGILHKDIKPSNVLMNRNGKSVAHPLLTDFGIGMLTDRSRLLAQNITQMTAFEKSIVGSNDLSRSGTRMYSPPESLVNKPYTIQGDIYSLGVMLYQMVAGDLTRPLGIGWERDVADDLLREDIAAAVEGDPSRRVASASEFARRLEQLEQRRADRVEADRINAETRAAKERAIQFQRLAQRRKRLLIVSSTLVVVLMAIAGVILILASNLHKETLAAKKNESLAQQAQSQAEQSQKDSDAAIGAFVNVFAPARSDYSLTVVKAVQLAERNFDKTMSPQVRDRVRIALGRTLSELGQYDQAIDVLRRASPERLAPHPADDLITAELFQALAMAMDGADRYKNGEEVYEYRRRALAMRMRLQPADSPDIMTLQSDISGMTALRENTIKGEENFLTVMRPYYDNKSLPELRAWLFAQLDQAKFLARQGRTDLAVGQIRSMLQPLLDNPRIRVDRPEVLHIVPDSMGMIGLLLLRRGDILGGELFGRTSVQLSLELNDPNDPHNARDMAGLATGFLSYGTRENGVEAVDLLKKALEIDQHSLGPANAVTMDHGASLVVALRLNDRSAEADQVQNELLGALPRAMPGSVDVQAGYFSDLCECVLGISSTREISLERAELDALRAAQLADQAYASKAKDGTYIDINLDEEQVLRRRGKFEDARKISQRMLQLAIGLFGQQDPRTGVVQNQLGLDLTGLKKYSDAVEVLEQAFQSLDASESQGDLVADCLLNLANARSDAGDMPGAIRGYRQYLAKCLVLHGQEETATVDAKCVLAQKLAETSAGRDEAYRLFEEALAVSYRVEGKDGDLPRKIRKTEADSGFSHIDNPADPPVRMH